MKKLTVTLIGLMTVLVMQAQIRLDFGKDAPLKKIQFAEVAIANLYVDSLDENQLAESAIRGMLEKLDPHSTYTDAKETKALEEPLQGDFEGIGVQFNIVDDTLLVVQPTTNGPSQKVGIMAGDRIVEVNDTAIAGVKMGRSDIMRRLRGKKGTMVHLAIVRRGVAGKLYFDVKRDKIPVHSVTSAYIVEPGIGYIRIESFGEKTYDEFISAIATLRKKGMNDLILDLQGNGGGYLQSAVQIANEFLNDGDMIVYTDGRKAGRKEYHAKSNGQFRQGKVVVLIDELTASAAEIVTGAIQDQDRGIVVGRRSFGKGLVQRPVPLPGGALLRLTVAHYYTPSGRCIQKPYKKGEKREYNQDLENRLKHGELTNSDSIHFSDSLKCYTLRKHRMVYGGGGIMPDCFVPLDTMRYTRYHRQLAAKSIVFNQDIKYIDQNRKRLQRRFSTFDNFRKNFDVPQELIDTIFAEGRKAGIEPKDSDELKRTLPLLRLQLKALIARDLWDMNEYYQVWNSSTDIFRKGVEAIKEN